MIGFFRRWQENNLKKIINQSGKDELKSGPVASVEFVGILFTAKNLTRVNEVQEFVQELEQLGQRCAYIAYVPRQIATKVDYGYLHFSQRDTTLFGVPHNRHIVQFKRRQFKCIINLAEEDVSALHYLCSKIPSRFKISLSPSYTNLYDICMAPAPEDDARETLAKTLDIFTKTCLNT